MATRMDPRAPDAAHLLHRGTSVAIVIEEPTFETTLTLSTLFPIPSLASPDPGEVVAPTSAARRTRRPCASVGGDDEPCAPRERARPPSSRGRGASGLPPGEGRRSPR